ncbi:hypothetical protein G6M50_09600 [Agrobacterium rhizogenes]|nr:hypothetical protein [Rhizobium rhizogenes]NTJ78052.1 hypothetical protein [Rhizobium rhizogenes]
MATAETAMVVIEKRGDILPVEIEMEAARSSLETGKFVAGGIYPFDASHFDFWPATASGAQQVVIGLAFSPQSRPANPGILVDVIVRLLGLALDCRQLRPRRQVGTSSL